MTMTFFIHLILKISVDFFADIPEKLFFCSKNIFCGMNGIEERDVAEIAKFIIITSSRRICPSS